jgi:hypothetical protein
MGSTRPLPIPRITLEVALDVPPGLDLPIVFPSSFLGCDLALGDRDAGFDPLVPSKRPAGFFPDLLDLLLLLYHPVVPFTPVC